MSQPAAHRPLAGFWPLLWSFVLLFCLLYAEVGHLAGFLDPRVAADLFPGADGWWRLASAVHALIAVLLAGALVAVGRVLLRGRRLPPTRWGRALAVVVALLGVFLCINQYGEMERVVSQATDFGTIRSAAVALADGGDPYAATGNAYFYPPFLALLLTPCTWLPAAGASLLFFTIKLVLVAWSLAAVHRLAAGDAFGGNRAVLFVFGLIFVGARFWMADLQYGNTNALIMYLVIAAIFWDNRDRALPAGVLLALAVSIKILPGLLALHFLARARWRTLLWFGAALLILHLAPLVWMSGTWIAVWQAYLDAGVTGKLSERLAQPDNQSLWGLLNRSFPTTPLAALRWVWAALSLLLLGWAGGLSYATRKHQGLVVAAAAALYPLLGLAISPGSWVVHYTAALLPTAVVWSLALGRRWPGAVVWVVFGLANFAFTASGWSRPTTDAAIHQSWFVAAGLLLCASLGWWILRHGRHEQPSAG